MNKVNINYLNLISFSIIFLFVNSSVNAHERVVVVPLTRSKTISYLCTKPDEVLSQGRCWKDRNLGATRVAMNSSDVLAYGDLYQWGRPRDGHQHRTSTTTFSTSEYDDPEHGDFIKANTSPTDWRNPQNDNLWQGLAGTNNPCPQGFRIPTADEWDVERQSWTSNDPAGAFDSPLKLPYAGSRTLLGVLQNEGNAGVYWSSTVYFSSARVLFFQNSGAGVNYQYRVSGYSIRCIKD